MVTGRATPFAFINSSSVSGVASRSGTRAPSANGNAGSCFHTCTCGSMRRSAGGAGAGMGETAFRRVRSGIDRLQRSDHVRSAAFVAGAGTVPGDVEIDAEPALERDALQDPAAGGEIDLAVAEVVDGI